jgi:hypothetical protein
MPKILVSDRCQIVMPYHVLFDAYEEERLAGKSFGSTKSGIAPFYSDKYAKIGFQVGELFEKEALKEKIEETHNLKFVGRCGLFVPVEDGVGGGNMLRVDGDKIGAVAGTKGYRWLESEDVKKRGLEDRIDKVYFRALIDSAVDHIAEYGDADEFING